MKPILITSGEPAGIGPDICLSLTESNLPVAIIGNLQMLQERAELLNKKIKFNIYNPSDHSSYKKNCLNIINIPIIEHVIPGTLNKNNAKYVITQLDTAIYLINNKQFHAIVTAPVHKGIINTANIKFTGHTEFFQHKSNTSQVVMMLICPELKLTTITTHIPLKMVANTINIDLIVSHIKIVANSLKQYFNCPMPKIIISGLNPHAGEQGHIGTEEINIINPAIKTLNNLGIEVHGPASADTMFSKKNMQVYDAFITLYHDQGLPVIKYLGFGSTVNITLGLPFIRTSVDHGTALELAGTNQASHASLHAAVKQAYYMIKNRANL